MKHLLTFIALLAALCRPDRAAAQQKSVTPLPAEASQGGTKAGTTYAVVVGISDYLDKDIPDLRFADKDAEAFANFLRSMAGGALDGDHLKLLHVEEKARDMGLVKNITLLFAKGHIEIDNNLVENIIRPAAIGRKNYRFAGSHEAAQRTAMLYTFFAACKHHDIDPEKWLMMCSTVSMAIKPAVWKNSCPKTGNQCNQQRNKRTEWLLPAKNSASRKVA